MDSNLNEITEINASEVEIAITGEQFRFFKKYHPQLLDQILVKSKFLDWFETWAAASLLSNL